MRILVVSDVHANLAALDAVVHAAAPFDRIWCLGDVVGYGPEPNECIALLRSFDLVCLAGNHDLGVVDKLELGEFSDDAQHVIRWTRERIAPDHRAWLASLPSKLVIPEHGITLVHGSPRDPIWEYVVTPGIARHCLDAIETPICLNGHTHIPMLYRKPTYGSGVVAEQMTVGVPMSLTLDQMVVNPGSVGQPRDEDVRAAFALVDLDSMTLTYRRVQYDLSATQKLMKRNRFPDRLIRRLRFGE